MNSPTTMNTVISSDSSSYQELSHSRLALAFVYANSIKTQHPGWRIVLQTTDPVFPVDPRGVVEKVTGRPFPEDGRVTTVLCGFRPSNLRLIGALYIEVTDDKLRSTLRKLDAPKAAPLNALLGELTDQRRQSFAENRRAALGCVACGGRGFVDRDDECGMFVQVECPKCGQGV